ncbi:MAG TPA: carboxypeptidase-like regulatory domain-containing protein [Saprospiraceae bacterium]|nr:carboxypeptidase-like regulatory domain-containing protein [Saprospiraceae bacterium]HMQ83540.1 carboxypeptidase-like regulatory domain-containing protein [Saprospiraceae bacterium]
MKIWYCLPRKKACIALMLLAFALNLEAQEKAEKKIQGSYPGLSLDLVLLDLKIGYGLEFKYDLKDIQGIRISKSIPKLPLSEAMTKLLEGTGLYFDIEPPNKITLSKIPIEKPDIKGSRFQPTAFDLTVTGIVKDGTSGESLPFANVLVEGSTVGATTNVDGWFTLFEVPSDTVLLQISYIGYTTQYFRLKPGMDFSNLSIRLLASGQVLQEVTVVSAKKEQMMKASTGISQISVAPAQLKALPSLGEKDIFRSLQLLPGVSGSNEGSSGLYVRGGTPDQNLVLFDGFTVYHVDHLFGFFSAFNSNAIKDVQLYKGGFEAKYGGRLSSVVDITGKDGNTEQFNIGGGISLLSVNAFAEIPFAKGKGSILLTGRRSFQSGFYNNLLEFSDGDNETEEPDGESETETFMPPFANTSTQPESWFYDLNGKVTWRSNRDVFSLSFYNGKDNLDNSRYSDENTFGGGGPFGGGGGGLDLNFQLDVLDLSDWGNTGSALKWSRRWNDKLYSNALVSYSNYFSHRTRGINSVIERDTTTTEQRSGTVEDNNLRDYSAKWDWEWKPALGHQIGFGVFGTAFDIKYDYVQNDTTTVLSRDDQGLLGGAYLQSKSTFFEKLILMPGLRFSYFEPTGKTYIEPRLQFQYLASDRIKLKAATGRFYQFANRIIREDVAQGSRDFWVLADGNNVPVGQSDHFIAGLSYETDQYLFDVEGYYKILDNITEYSTRFVLNGFGPGASLDFEENFYNGTGIAKGIEWLAQKKAGKITGWVSYTLGQVTHQFDVYGADAFPAAHDVTHELKIVGMYQVGKWSFGGTFIYATGKPYTAPLGAYTVALLDGNTTDHFAVSNKNALRLPDYHRLDLSVNRDFDRFWGGQASMGLSLFNLYGRQNTWYKEYEVVDGVILETDVNFLGFTPSLYFNWSLK